MKNIERHGFSNAVASTEFRIMHNLGPMASWGSQVWIDYCKWLCEESKPGAFYLMGDSSKVNHPKHYRHKSGLDAMDWIDRFNMSFCQGNVFKYLFRRGLKPGESFADDEQKAKWYFRHEAEEYLARSFTWEEAKRKVAEKLIWGFMPPGMKKLDNGDIVPDWSTGGCDMPDAIEFINLECLTM